MVYDPEADTTIKGEDMLSEAKYTPYDGMRTRGSIAQVYLRGKLAVEHGEVKIGAAGTFIPRTTGTL